MIEDMVRTYENFCALRFITPRNDVRDTIALCAGHFDTDSTVRVDVAHTGLIVFIVWRQDTGACVYGTSRTNQRKDGKTYPQRSDWLVKVMVQQPSPKGVGWCTCIEKYTEDKFVRRGMRKRYGK